MFSALGSIAFYSFLPCWSPFCLHSIEYLCEFHPAIYLLKALREWFQRSVCSPWKSKINLSVVCVTATVTFEGRNNTFFFLQVKCWIIERNYIHLLIQWLCCYSLMWTGMNSSYCWLKSANLKTDAEFHWLLTDISPPDYLMVTSLKQLTQRNLGKCREMWLTTASAWNPFAVCAGDNSLKDALCSTNCFKKNVHLPFICLCTQLVNIV